MVLGTCNQGQMYNGVEVSKKDSLKIIDEFYKLGGRIVDTAANYNSQPIIAEWLKQNKGNELKIITKIWDASELEQAFEELGVNKIHCILGRENNYYMREFLKDQQRLVAIEKWGMSLYLPTELDKSYFNVLQIPCDPIWFSYIGVLSLYSKIYIRSYYNHYVKNYDKEGLPIKPSDKVQYVVGCDTVEQLKQNMEFFK